MQFLFDLFIVVLRLTSDIYILLLIVYLQLKKRESPRFVKITKYGTERFKAPASSCFMNCLFLNSLVLIVFISGLRKTFCYNKNLN